MVDDTELHLASLRFVDTLLELTVVDQPSRFARQNTQTFSAPPPHSLPPTGLPPDRGIELVLESGDLPMPRTRPIKCLSEGELTELRRQLLDLLNRG